MTSRELNKFIDWVFSMKPGIYELKNKYQVIKEISINKKIYKRGSVVMLAPSVAERIKSSLRYIGTVEERQKTINQIKYYIDYRGMLPIPEIELSNDYTKVRIYPMNI